MTDNNVSPTEGEVQIAVVEVASKKIIELTQSNILLEAGNSKKVMFVKFEQLKQNLPYNKTIDFR